MRAACCFFVVVFAVGAAGTDCFSEETKVENPVYRNWKAFPSGAMVTYRVVTDSKDFHEERFMTYRLTEISDTQLIVEMKNYLKGQKPEDVDGRKMTSQRLVRLPEGIKKEDFGKRTGAIQEGKETVELAGGKWASEWSMTKVRVEAGETESKTWTCRDIPGGLVQSVNTTAATGSKTTIDLIEVVIPKK